MKPIIINMSDISESREVYDSKPQKIIIVFQYSIILLLITAVIWMAFGRIELVIRSEGVIRPDGQVSTVVNLYEGIIEEVFVEEGSRVKKDDILYIMNHDLIINEKEYLTKQLETAEEEIRLLELYMKSVQDNENYVFGESEEYNIKFMNYQLTYLEQELKCRQEENLFIFSMDGKEEYGGLVRLRNNEISIVLDQINKYKNKIEEMNLSLEKSKELIEKAIVKAEAEGIISSKLNLVKGGMLHAGQEIYTILPENESGYKVYIYVANSSIGKLAEGMKVKYSIYSFPGSEYGYQSGIITKISEDVIVNDSNKGYYLVEASLDAKELYDKNRNKVQIKPGMDCQAHVITGEESILNYMIGKLY